MSELSEDASWISCAACALSRMAWSRETGAWPVWSVQMLEVSPTTLALGNLIWALVLYGRT